MILATTTPLKAELNLLIVLWCGDTRPLFLPRALLQGNYNFCVQVHMQVMDITRLWMWMDCDENIFSYLTSSLLRSGEKQYWKREMATNSNFTT